LSFTIDSAYDYSGTVSGTGKDKTIIEATQGFKALPDSYLNRPGTEVASMFEVCWPTGDITFQDITFLVTGEAPAELHNNPFTGTKTTMDNIIVVTEGIGCPITVTFKNLQIKGETSNDSHSSHGYNLMWPLIAVGQNAQYRVDLIAENCEIDNCGQVGLEYWHAHGGVGEINGNVFSNCYTGVWLGPGLADSEVNVKNNEFINITTAAISNTYGCLGCFMNNTLDGEPIADNCPQ
jgi:hypothetical protein